MDYFGFFLSRFFGFFSGFSGFFGLFWIFEFFEFFFLFSGISFKVTNVTTKSYQGYYWTPKISKNGPKQHNNLLFCPKGKKSLGRSPPQDLEVGPRSGPYLLVAFKTGSMARLQALLNRYEDGFIN